VYADSGLPASFLVSVGHLPNAPAGYTPITTAQELEGVANDLSEKYILMADIDLASAGNWTPLGNTATQPFTGVLDGNGYAIKNMNIDSATLGASTPLGLIGYAGGNVTIKNLALQNVEIVGKNQHVGGLIGYAQGRNLNLTIDNCYVTGDMEEKSGSDSYMAGLVGYVYTEFSSQRSTTASIDISNCRNYADINKHHGSAAGILGYFGNQNDASYIVTYCSNLTFSNNENYGAIAASGSAAGLVAYLQAGFPWDNSDSEEIHISLSDQKNFATIRASGGYAAGIIGGIQGYSNTDSPLVKTIEISECENKGEIFALNTSGHAGGIIGGAQYVSTARVTSCKNMASINASGSYAGGIVGKLSLACTRGENNSEKALVKNCENSGNITSSSNTGGIVGYFSMQSSSVSKTFPVTLAAEIETCRNTGLVSSGSSSAGIIGSVSLNGDSNNGSALLFIRKCYNAGNMKGYHASGIAGDLSGSYSSDVTIIDCYNAGNLSYDKDYYCIGGIVSYASSSTQRLFIENCYQMGALPIPKRYSSNYVGTLIWQSSSTVNIKNTYYLENANPVVGSNSTPVLNNVRARSQAQMADQASFSGFDFSNVWQMPTSGAPVLRAFPLGSNPVPAVQYAVVIFDTDGGTAIGARSVLAGAQVGVLPIPVKNGYEFLGWYNGATQVSENTVVSQNVTFKARWRVSYNTPQGSNATPQGSNNTPQGSSNQTKYTIKFDANGGDVGSVAITVVSIAKDAALGTLPQPKRVGYTFGGWYTAKSGGTKIVASTKAISDETYYAHWAAKEYTVKFHPNGGKKLSAKNKKKTVIYDARFGKLPNITKKGYKFMGWYTKKSGGKKIKATSKVTITKTTTLYAHWKKR
jgi:uncharacterized repeat protein (TIGR02543 family)